MKKTRIAVTGLNAGDSPAPGMPVARCLHEVEPWNGKIIGLAYDALESGIFDRSLLDSAYLLPYPNTGKEALLERLTYISATTRVDAIIPTLDAEIINFIRLRESLAKMGIKTLLPSVKQFNARAKANLPELAKKLGLQTPRTRSITSPSEIDSCCEQLPVMVKGLFYEAYLAYTMAEVRYYVDKIAASWGYPVLLQEFIEGEEYNAAAVGDGDGQLVGCAGMKKLVITDRGKGWACVSIENQELNALTEKIVQGLRWPGALEVEAVKSKHDGQLYLLELNPRFPAWIYLAKAAGVNLPQLYLELLLGEELTLPKHDYRWGVVFSNYTTNLISDMDGISGLMTAGELNYV